MYIYIYNIILLSYKQTYHQDHHIAVPASAFLASSRLSGDRRSNGNGQDRVGWTCGGRPWESPWHRVLTWKMGIYHRSYGNLWPWKIIWKMMIHWSMEWGTRFRYISRNLWNLIMLQYLSPMRWLSMQRVQFSGVLTTARPPGWSTCLCSSLCNAAVATRPNWGRSFAGHVPHVSSGGLRVENRSECLHVPMNLWVVGNSWSDLIKNALLCFGKLSTGKEPQGTFAFQMTFAEDEPLRRPEIFGCMGPRSGDSLRLSRDLLRTAELE